MTDTSAKAVWPRVSKSARCPICHKPDACKVSPDNSVCMCKRVEQGAFKHSKGWHFHRLNQSAKPRAGGKGHRTQAMPDKGIQLYATAQAASDAAGRQCGGKLVAQWAYEDRGGGEVLRVIRFSLPDGGKAYRPIHPANGGWRIGDPAGLLPLYRVNELPAGGLAWLTEGEKAADAAARIGLAATTSAHGAGSADRSDWQPLAGRDVVILPDNDEPGRQYAQAAARLLVQLNPPAKPRIVQLPDLPDKGDIVEYIEARRNQAPASIRAEIEALAGKAAVLAPGDMFGGPVLVCMADVEAKPIAWLWPGRIALGCITLLAGRPGEGKSFLTTDLAARVTTGSPWPDGTDCPLGSVILIAAEDDPARTMRPRLDAHRADVKRVHLLAMVKKPGHDGKPAEMLFTLADVGAMESALNTRPDCKLVVIDPIGSFLGGGTDAHRDNEVRSVLAPVAKLVERYGVAALIVAHVRKATAGHADDLVLGSRGFTGIARSVLHVCLDKDDTNRRLLLSGKNNLAKQADGLAFTIAGEPPAIVWEPEPVRMNADDALAEDAESQRPGPPADARRAAEGWLRDVLANGPVPSGDVHNPATGSIRALAKEADMTWRTVRRAADFLGVRREKCPHRKVWLWRLPKPASEVGQLPVNAANLDNLANFNNPPEIPSKSRALVLRESDVVHDDLSGTTSPVEGGGI